MNKESLSYIQNIQFNVQADSSYRITLQIFEAAFTLYASLASKLFKEYIEVNREARDFPGWQFSLYNKDYWFTDRDWSNRVLYMDESLIKESAKAFHEYCNTLQKDIRQFQQWVSIWLNGEMMIMEYVPPILRKALNISYNPEYVIPLGKEELWHKMENKINYYLGLKLLV